MDDLVDILLTKRAEDVVALKIYREGKTLIKKVKLKKYPDPGYKPSWVAGSKLFKNVKQKNERYGLENTLLVGNNMILYPKYFSKEIISKYDHDYLIVACVPRGGKSILKPYDQILSINGKNPRNGYKLSNDPVPVKFKRNNKVYNKKITPVLDNFINIRHECTPEFADFDCVADSIYAQNLPSKDSNGDLNNEKKLAFKKTLDCYSKNKVSLIPFHNIFEKTGNVIFDDYNDYLYFNTMQYPEGHKKEQENLPEIKRSCQIPSP